MAPTIRDVPYPFSLLMGHAVGMLRPPFLVRVGVGLTVYIAEEARKLPGQAVSLPITAISQFLQTTMHAQQFVTSLALKGDQVFAQLTGEEFEQPEWATFDEDAVDIDELEAPDRDKPGRFALYSMPPDSEVEATTAAPAGDAGEPEIVQYLDYPALTLAQLRARLRSLSIDDLDVLLDFEERTLSRAPFLTMLANRITSAKAK